MKARSFAAPAVDKPFEYYEFERDRVGVGCSEI